MPPTVVCHCDPSHNQGRGCYAACETCLARAELARRHRAMVEAGVVRALSAHPSTSAWAALLAGGAVAGRG